MIFRDKPKKLTSLKLALYIVHHGPLIHKGSMHKGRSTGAFFENGNIVQWKQNLIFFLPCIGILRFFLPFFGILGFFSACFGILGASADVNVLDGCLHAWLSICIEPQCPANKKAKRKEGESLITPSALTMPACGRRTQSHLNP